MGSDFISQLLALGMIRFPGAEAAGIGCAATISSSTAGGLAFVFNVYRCIRRAGGTGLVSHFQGYGIGTGGIVVIFNDASAAKQGPTTAEVPRILCDAVAGICIA